MITDAPPDTVPPCWIGVVVMGGGGSQEDRTGPGGWAVSQPARGGGGSAVSLLCWGVGVGVGR